MAWDCNMQRVIKLYWVFLHFSCVISIFAISEELKIMPYHLGITQREKSFACCK